MNRDATKALFEGKKPEKLGPDVGLERLLTPVEAASHLRLSMSWLAKSRLRGDGPRYRKFGRSVRYTVFDLDEFVKSRGCSSTSAQKLLG